MKMEKERIIEEELEETQKININPGTYNKLKKQFEAREKELRLDIENIAVRTIFISDGPDGKNRRIYTFYLNKNSSIEDLKIDIKRDFGWDPSQINVFFQYKELKNFDLFQKIENFDYEEDVLLVHMNTKKPDIKLPVYLKQRMDDISMNDVKFFNSSGENDLIIKRDGQTYEFPEYWDWHSKLIELNQTVQMAMEELEYSIEKQESLDLLIQAEKEYKKLEKKFEEAAIKSVKTIIESQATPLNIFNLYGDGGKKYTSAGMFIRHLDEWLLHEKYILNKFQWK